MREGCVRVQQVAHARTTVAKTDKFKCFYVCGCYAYIRLTKTYAYIAALHAHIFLDEEMCVSYACIRKQARIHAHFFYSSRLANSVLRVVELWAQNEEHGSITTVTFTLKQKIKSIYICITKSKEITLTSLHIK